MSEIIKQSKLAWARYDNRKTTLAPAKDGPSCVDHHSAKYCAKMKEIHACQNAEVREECAKTCGVCTPPGIPVSASETSTPTTPWPANFGLATRRPKCFDQVNDCVRVKNALRCAEGDYPDICAKTCGFCTEPASATESESEPSS
ncbi:hypothetical protein AAVH_39858 [Aphelenchoides avenae]|nr:hypothetical protein AAVH_39858 [Aphelenchus avenae]